MRDECQHGQLLRQCDMCELIDLVRTLSDYITRYRVPNLVERALAGHEREREAGES